MQGTIAEICREIECHPARSAWDRGVRSYAGELFEAYMTGKGLHPYDADGRIGKITDADLLNGAGDWSRYSYGGCADVHDADICERLCCPSEAKKKKHGELPPNAGETWLDVQARALKQAARLVERVVNRRDLSVYCESISGP